MSSQSLSHSHTRRCPPTRIEEFYSCNGQQQQQRRRRRQGDVVDDNNNNNNNCNAETEKETETDNGDSDRLRVRSQRTCMALQQQQQQQQQQAGRSGSGDVSCSGLAGLRHVVNHNHNHNDTNHISHTSRTVQRERRQQQQQQPRQRHHHRYLFSLFSKSKEERKATLSDQEEDDEQEDEQEEEEEEEGLEEHHQEEEEEPLDEDDFDNDFQDEMDQESLLLLQLKRHSAHPTPHPSSSSSSSSFRSHFHNQNAHVLSAANNTLTLFQDVTLPLPTTTVIRFRPIQPKDRIQIQQLHEQWFPVQYQQEFYDDLCSHRRMCNSGHALYTMVATLPKILVDKTNTTTTTTSPTPQQQQEDECCTDECTSDERIIACLVGCILSAHKLNAKSRRLLVPAFPHQHSKLFYIMTLGTVKEYRHLGLATQLVRQVEQNVVTRDNQLGTIYLHVITLNDAAIRFYEDKLGFYQVQEIQDYYSIDGHPYNCFLYAKFYHGNRGHLDVLQVVAQWISSVWSSFWHLAKRYYS
jgi:histone acetyltransferase MCC1